MCESDNAGALLARENKESSINFDSEDVYKVEHDQGREGLLAYKNKI